jgi:hypothetical protein
LHGKKTKQKSDLSRHYREIGIKAVAAATRKDSTASPRTRDSMAINRKRTRWRLTAKGTKEDTMTVMNEASRITRESFDQTLETGAQTARGVQEGITSALENVRNLNVRLIEMARANTHAAFDFAREVAETKAPSDLVQAWTTHASKQFDMLTKQASDLTTLGQQFASTSSEPVTRRVAQGFRRQ